MAERKERKVHKKEPVDDDSPKAQPRSPAGAAIANGVAGGKKRRTDERGAAGNGAAAAAPQAAAAGRSVGGSGAAANVASGRRPTLAAAPDEDTLRILVATDNHLGYNETDPIRGNDSFKTFEEIFQIAVDNQVDFILLGGDLFHDNKPSRQCLFKAMQVFRNYCFGERPISFEVVSDQAINFPDTKCVNYEDPNFNIALPVFAIHGNHDDPAGMGGYSAMDLLNSCNLLNYFGKSERVDDITNYPILIKKGKTKLAMYGMGNVRDERLHRTFKQNKVKWVRPAADKTTWFNLCVLHQNRTKHSAEQKNFIHESMLPKFLDIVIWGHEHECLIDLEASLSGQYEISQPGSSVATSLMPGEAVTKKVGILEVKGDQFRMQPVLLKTVRPFTMGDVKLNEFLEIPGEGGNIAAISEHVEEFLSKRVHDMITKALEDDPNSKDLPLIRLRVDHTGYPKLNVQRFGQRFVGKVANPDELLLFHRQRKIITRAKPNGNCEYEEVEVKADDLEVDEAPPIPLLVANILKGEGKSLSILAESVLADAIQQYVDKKDTDAIPSCVSKTLEEYQKDLARVESKDDIDTLITKHRDRLRAAERAAAQDEENKDAADGGNGGAAARSPRAARVAPAAMPGAGGEGKERKGGREAKAPAKDNRKLDQDLNDLEEEGGDNIDSKEADKLLAGLGLFVGKGGEDDDDEDKEREIDRDDDDEKPTRARARASSPSAAGRGRGRAGSAKAKAKTKSTRGRGGKTAAAASSRAKKKKGSDDDMDVNDDDDDAPKAKPKRRAAAKKPSTKKGSSPARGAAAAIDIEEISDDDDPKPAAAVRKAPARAAASSSLRRPLEYASGDDDVVVADVKPRKVGALAMASQATQASAHDAAPKPSAATAWGDKKRPAAAARR